MEGGGRTSENQDTVHDPNVVETSQSDRAQLTRQVVWHECSRSSHVEAERNTTTAVYSGGEKYRERQYIT